MEENILQYINQNMEFLTIIRNANSIAINVVILLHCSYFTEFSYQNRLKIKAIKIKYRFFTI